LKPNVSRKIRLIALPLHSRNFRAKSRKISI
jgi:hypothetical protein